MSRPSLCILFENFSRFRFFCLYYLSQLPTYGGLSAVMLFITWPVLLKIISCTLSFYGIYHIYWEFTVGASRRRLSQEKHCQPIKKHASGNYKLGLDLVWETYKRLSAHTLLDWRLEQFSSLKTNTFQMRFLHSTAIITADPENLKSILSLDFKSWSLGAERKKVFADLLGEGIFTTDGAAWQHSRDLLRPSFMRSHISDFQMLETHVGHLIDVIPRDGSTVDLHKLFFCSTLDIATDFLFGENNNSLAPSADRDRYMKFCTGFDYCLNISEEAEWKVFVWNYLPDRRFKRECKAVHGRFTIVTGVHLISGQFDSMIA